MHAMGREASGKDLRKRSLRSRRPAIFENDPINHQHIVEDVTPETFGLESSFSLDRSLQMLDQDKMPGQQFVCESLDVVDACRGTSNGYRYRGKFFPYDGPCDGGGKLLEGYPIYKTNPGNGGFPTYMYALGVYPDTWSVVDLRGLVRWRIVDFEDFKDQTSCRTESANVNQIDFAADGMPYNYWPTIYCFDEKGKELDGFKSSTINIRCNDRTPPVGYNGDGNNRPINNSGNNGMFGPDESNNDNNNNNNNNSGGAGPGDENSNTTLVLGILLIVAAIGFSCYVLYNRAMPKDRYSKRARKTRGGKTNSGSTNKSPPTKITVDTIEKEPLTGDEGSENSPYRKGGGNGSFAASFSSSSRGARNHPTKPASERIRTSFRGKPASERQSNRTMARRPSAPELYGQKPRSEYRRPFSSNSIMPDSSHSNKTMLTVSKPYELLKRMTTKAPEPPKTPSPPSSADAMSRTSSRASNSQGFGVTGKDKTVHSSNGNHSRAGSKSSASSFSAASFDDFGAGQPPKKQQQPQNPSQKPQQQKPEQQRSSRTLDRSRERGRDPSVDSRASFMSTSLSNMFDKIGKSLDDAFSSHGDGAADQNTTPSEHKDPPEQKSPTKRRPSILGRGKSDDMDLSQRSRFMETRGKWSARGKASSSILGLSNHGKQSSKTSKPYGSGSHQPRRSKSLDSSDANGYAKKQKAPATKSRSRSNEPSGASTWAQQKASRKDSRSKSRERSNANAFAEKSRSRSKDRSGANDYLSKKRTKKPSRSRSRESSGADKHARSKRSSRSRERSGADAFAARKARRSKSRDQSKTNAPAEKNGRGRSKERSGATSFAQHTNPFRSNSRERSGANEYASNKGRSKSLDQSGANAYANRDASRRSHSLERTPADNHASSRDVRPLGRSRSFDTSEANQYAADRNKQSRRQSFSGSGDQPGRSNTKHSSVRRSDTGNVGSKKRSTSAKKPKATTIITKNSDGTVVVARKRRRDDGATVTTKTKYANIALARKHGVAV